jgi:hypothetical protein
MILCAVKLVYMGIRAAEATQGKGRTRTASEVFSKIRNVLTPRPSFDNSGGERASTNWADWGADDRRALFKDSERILVGVKRKGKRGEAPVRVSFGVSDGSEVMRRKICSALGMDEGDEGKIKSVEGDDGCLIRDGGGLRDGEILSVVFVR